MTKKTRFACQGLHACSGCEIAMIDAGQKFLELFESVELVHFPLLMDSKYSGYRADEFAAPLRLPDAEIGLVSGGVATEEQLVLLNKMRESCKMLVSFGTCATHGGIPALLNSWPMDEAIKSIFETSTTEKPLRLPGDGLPPMLDRVYALDEKVEVDIFLPGCPPDSQEILNAIEALIHGSTPIMPQKSVCDTCPTIRKGKSETREVKRFLENIEYREGEPLEKMRCLLEQGHLCMGPVTAAGCAGRDGPKCIVARVPCRGCFGPVKMDGNQMLDMMNALASSGADWKTVVDRRSLLRFSGAHGLLRPRRGKRSK